ncbi:MAG: PHP domain-containing protein [Candidatus Omnitrophica bacterium]|nr:PHP domain-containing protein [Candidatus Omnitrophota bacterium]
MPNNGGADLHCHTLYSDGTFSPAQVFERARDEGLEAVAITDHDSTEGLYEADQAARHLGLGLIAGVEITGYEDGSEVHILGLFVDARHKPLGKKLLERRTARVERLKKMIQKLREEGHEVAVPDVLDFVGPGAVGRLHLARFLVEKGIVKDVTAAFKRFLATGAACYVPNAGFPAEDAIRLIHEAGGISILAHPGLNHRDDLIAPLKEMGLMGIEVYHTGHDSRTEARYLKLARQLGLAVSAGSDCHGLAKGRPVLGTKRISMHELENLRAHCG